MRKQAFGICENKDADQLRSNREADQRLCFRYTDSTIPRLPKSNLSSLQLSCVVVQPGLCRTWLEDPGFLTTRLIYLESLSQVRDNPFWRYCPRVIILRHKIHNSSECAWFCLCVTSCMVCLCVWDNKPQAESLASGYSPYTQTHHTLSCCLLHILEHPAICASLGT